MSGQNQEKERKSDAKLLLGEFIFLVESQELTDKSGSVIHLRRQSTDVLTYLSRHHGTLVRKEDLTDNVWNRSFVTDDSLVKCIADIRRVLGDTHHRIVQTHPKKGYLLAAEVLAKEIPAPVDELKPFLGAPRTGLPRWIPWSVVAIFVGIGLVAWAVSRPDFEPVDPVSMRVSLPDRPSIAVLAFEDFSVGTDHSYLSDAVAEGITSGLSRFHELFVVARNSSFQFRGGSTDIREIAKTLGVRYVVEGSQQKDGDALKVTVQLIDALEGSHLWTETYDGRLRDVFSVQEDVVRRVVATVAEKLIEYEAREASSNEMSRLTALHHNLRGRPFLRQFSEEGTEQARLANLDAINADPDQPYGYIGLAYVYINGYRWGWGHVGREDSLALAREMAQKALALAPDYYDSHATMGYVHVQAGELDRAIARFEHALALNPNSTIAMGNLVEALGYAGRAQEAEALQIAAMRLDPLHPDWMKWNLAWIQWLNRDCGEALNTMHEMSNMPTLSYRMLAIIHVCLDQPSEAEAAILQLLEHHPSYSIADVRENFQGKFRNSADLERYVSDLRMAGLPE